jgi:serine protease Do
MARRGRWLYVRRMRIGATKRVRSLARGAAPHASAAWLLVAALLPACDNRVHASMREHRPEGGPPAPSLVRFAGEGGDPSAGMEEVVARVEPSVVNVLTSRALDLDVPFNIVDHPGMPRRERAAGAGFVITSDGLVITNSHVVEGADQVRARLADRKTFDAVVVGRDSKLDVALLQLEGAEGLVPAELGSSETMRVGELVFAMGNPFGLGISVTRGVLSAKSRSLGAGLGDLFLQTDAAINPGNSGGPLFDRAGRVVGITTAIVAHARGVSFAIPIDDVRPVLDELKKTGRVARGRMGIAFQALTPSLATALKLPAEAGALVSEVEANGPAASAGLEPGDVVVRFNGLSIDRAPDLAHELGRRKPGEITRVEILRDGRPKAIDVKLDRLEETDDDADPPKKRPRKSAASGGPPLGIRTADADGGGARIEALDPESPAADELNPGDVIVEMNRTDVRGAADLASRLATTRRPAALLFRIRRGDSFVYVGVDVKK